MSEQLPSFDQALEMLKKAVKDSHIKNQKHIDLTLVNADIRSEYERALMVVNKSVIKGELTQAELKSKLGLI